MPDALAILPIPRRLLTATLLLLGALMAPHAFNLDPAILGFFYLTMVWRLLAQGHPDWMPGRLLLLFLMVSALALVVMTTGLGDGRLAGTALLVVMLGLKLLELRARRDIHITVFLGYFLVLTQFLYNQALWLAVYAFAGVLALFTIQVGLNRVRVNLRRQLRGTGSMIAAAAPLTLVVFLLFPRLDNPLWGINAPRAFTGISDEMSLGNIGSLSQSEAVAFRVRFLGEVPPPAQRYWRGPVLWKTDGRQWSAGYRPVRAVRPAGRRGERIDYEVTLEPTGQYWLFGLDTVIDRPATSFLNTDYTLISEQRLNRRLTFRAGSDPDYRILGLTEFERARALQLPEQVSERVSSLVESWRRGVRADQPLQLVRKALAYYSENPFIYTLAPGTLQGEDPIDEFLFETRRGFCEHYASSFALLMRVAGIPTRVVLGYQGGEKNPHAEHWVVRQSDAHAWAEVWVPQLGWWRVDPTAAVAPERIEQPINPALSQTGDRVVFRGNDDSMLRDLWRNVAWVADAVDLGWHRWVVGFNAARQKGLLQQLGLEHLRGFGLALALLIGSSLAMALVYLIAQLPRPQAKDPLPSLWQRFLRKLQRAGLQTAAWQGPDTVHEAARQAFPDASARLAAINRIYVQLRYGRHRDTRMIGVLRRHIRLLRLERRRPLSETR